MTWKRPTLDTPFHIDWEWWKTRDRNYRVYLYEQLCPECRRRFPSPFNVEEVDWVDPKTAEVTRADALLMCLRTRCANDPDFVNESLPLAAAIFRVFLISGNAPLTPTKLHDHLPWRTPETILQVLGDRQSHFGIRPMH